ncbi:MAG: GNAT family N-acetyltransferase [Acidimicrobiales bacterium]
MPLQIRSASEADHAFLEDMTFEAIFVRPDTEPFGREVLDDPSIRHYFAEFGRRPGDTGLVAFDGDRPVGAAWVRRFSAEHPGYGWVDEHTPELTIALAPSHRNLGLGAQLLTALFKALAEQGVVQLCLSVDDLSPARALYRRLGFVEVAEEGTAVTMLRQLP